MGAGERRDLLFVIYIPETVEVGEHTGGIFIQKKSKDEAEQGNGSKVMLTTRVGVRIYETVPGEIFRKLSFSDFQIAKNFSEFFLPWDKIKKEKFKMGLNLLMYSIRRKEGRMKRKGKFFNWQSRSGLKRIWG